MTTAATPIPLSNKGSRGSGNTCGVLLIELIILATVEGEMGKL